MEQKLCTLLRGCECIKPFGKKSLHAENHLMSVPFAFSSCACSGEGKVAHVNAGLGVTVMLLLLQSVPGPGFQQAPER